MLGSEIELSLKVMEIAFYIVMLWFVYRVVKSLFKRIVKSKVVLFLFGFFLGEFLFKKFGYKIKGTAHNLKYELQNKAEEYLSRGK